MAILNVTPDSFYPTSRTTDADSIAARAHQAVTEGADIIDVGGYSSRPDAADVEESEELRRVMRGVGTVRSLYPSVPISIDTFRSRVAEAVLEKYGPVTVNDISAGDADPRMIDVVSAYGAPYVAMHMRGTPRTMQSMTSYADVAAEVSDALLRRADSLAARGVKEIILDPGFGFAKTAEQNFVLLASLEKLTGGGFPVLVGISRKSFIYKTLGATPEDVLAATTALHWECLRRGAAILRVHDVAAARQTVDLYEKTTGIWNGKR